MLCLDDKPGLFVFQNCLTESLSGIHSVISSRCLYLITPLLYMFFHLHVFWLILVLVAPYILEVCVLVICPVLFQNPPPLWLGGKHVIATLYFDHLSIFRLCKVRSAFRPFWRLFHWLFLHFMLVASAVGFVYCRNLNIWIYFEIFESYIYFYYFLHLPLNSNLSSFFPIYNFVSKKIIGYKTWNI